MLCLDSFGGKEFLPGAESAEARRFFILMRLHPQQHIIQQLHGLHDEGALVQHDAFRSVGHDYIRHLGAGRHPALRQALKHLGRPDDRDVCSLTQPEELLLHFGDAFVAKLHS